MKNKITTTITYLMIGLLYLLNPLSAQEWQTITSPPTTDDLFLVDFVDEENGWVLSRAGELFGTGDAGANWVMLYQFQMGAYPVELKFVDAQNGWLVLTHQVYRTTDGGDTWSSSETGFDQANKDAFFINALNGWLAVRTVDGMIDILQTQDGGAIFEPVFQGLADLYIGMQWATPTIGYLLTTSTLYRLDTTNGALHVLLESADLIFAGMHFFDETKGFVFTAESAPIRLETTDGGATWEEESVTTEVPFDLAPYSGGFHFSDEQRGGYFFAGFPFFGGWVLANMTYTTDGGMTWTNTDPPDRHLTDISMGDGAYYFSGHDGVVLKWMPPQASSNEKGKVPELLLEVMPNPASHHFTITAPEGLYRMALLKQDGRVVRQWVEKVTNATSVDISGLSDGAYFLLAKRGEAVDVRKVMVVNDL